MDLEHIEQTIVEGAPDEDPADLLFMTDTVGDLVVVEQPRRFWVTVGNARRLENRFPIPHGIGDLMVQAKYAAGLLLCPIFDPVKHRRYVEAMDEVRQEYRGVAGDPELRSLFRSKANDAMKQGALVSLNAAMKKDLARMLERKSRYARSY